MENTVTNRNINVDFLKCLACIAVVGLHTISRDSNSIVYYLCTFAIPVFFVSSGYFLLNKKSVSCKYISNKIFRILRVVFIWSILLGILGGGDSSAERTWDCKTRYC